MKPAIFSIYALLVCILGLNLFNASSGEAASFCRTPFTESTALDADFVNDGRDDSSPVLKTDGQGNWLAAWRHELPPANPLSRPLSYVLLKRSTNKGESWQETKWISCGSVNCFSYALEPQMATDGNGKWLVAWTDMHSGAGATGNIIFSRSTDNGQTWSEPQRVNVPAATDSISFTVDALVHGQSSWIVSGSYVNDGKQTAYYYRSTDAGLNWNGPLSIDNTQGTSKFNVKLATDHKGNWIAGWTSADPSSAFGANSIMTSSSSNDGQSWSTPKNQGFQESAGAYIGDLEYGSNGYWVMVWESDMNLDNPSSGAVSYNILLSYSTNLGNSWSPATWLYGDVNDTSDDTQPRLFTDNSGNLSCVWYRSDNYGTTIGQDAWVYQRCSANGGSSWLGVEDLNRSMQSNVLIERVPSIAMDPDGKVLALWSAWRKANGAASDDASLFFSGAVSTGLGVCNSGALSILLLNGN